MCIRDSAEIDNDALRLRCYDEAAGRRPKHTGTPDRVVTPSLACLLYTSDAADDLLCVDLGGRRIIKKKKKTTTHYLIHTFHKLDNYNIR